MIDQPPVPSETTERNPSDLLAREKRTQQWSTRILYTSIFFCCVSFLIATLGIYSYWQSQTQRIKEAKLQTKREATLASIEIERELREYQKPALSLANLLSHNQVTGDNFVNQIQQKIENNYKLLTLGAAYTPLTTDTLLYAPGYIRRADEIQFIQLENFYDYTNPQYNWFRETLNQGSGWGEPYSWPKNSGLDQPVVGFYSPFYERINGKEVPQGVVYAEYSFKDLEEIMSSLNLGKTGYAFLMSKTGIFMTHPNGENVINQRTLFDVFKSQNNQQLTYLISQAFEGEMIETEFLDQITGQKSWLYLQPLELNGWVIGIVFLEQEVFFESDTRRRKLIFISLALMSFLSSLSSILLKIQTRNIIRLWVFTGLTSLLIIIQIGLIWRLALSDRNYLSNRFLLLNQADPEKIIASQVRERQRLQRENILRIPTGVFIESIDFPDSSEVFITAYIWQRYKTGIHDDLSRGFILPDSVDANDLEVQEVYNKTQGYTELIGWYVEATLRQKFDYSRYPFDPKDIEIQIWHPDLNRQVVLVPDFTAYELMNPRLQPGVNQDIALYGWILESSFFEYKFREYNTNLGFTEGFFKGDLPDLYFTVAVKRQFIDPLISRLVALICVVSLLFAMLLVLNSDRGMEVLGIAAGLIFIVIVDQIAIREEVAAGGLIYFDYFYFVIYFYIFLISVIALMLLNDTPTPKFLKYKENLITELLYWPSLLGTLLIVTLFVFF